MPAHRWTEEEAKEQARKAVEAKATKAERIAQLRAEHAAKDPLFAELVDAVYGQGNFSGLPADKRLAALFKLMEYTVGKPARANAKPESDPETETSVAFQ